MFISQCQFGKADKNVFYTTKTKRSLFKFHSASYIQHHVGNFTCSLNEINIFNFQSILFSLSSSFTLFFKINLDHTEQKYCQRIMAINFFKLMINRLTQPQLINLTCFSAWKLQRHLGSPRMSN